MVPHRHLRLVNGDAVDAFEGLHQRRPCVNMHPTPATLGTPRILAVPSVSTKRGHAKSRTRAGICPKWSSVRFVLSCSKIGANGSNAMEPVALPG